MTVKVLLRDLEVYGKWAPEQLMNRKSWFKYFPLCAPQALRDNRLHEARLALFLSLTVI